MDAQIETQADMARAAGRAFDVLGMRWSGPIMVALIQGTRRFTDLHRAVKGISERMLSERLTTLATAGLVARKVEGGPPLRVSYSVTAAGAALAPAVRELAAWAEQHLPAAGP